MNSHSISYICKSLASLALTAASVQFASGTTLLDISLVDKPTGSSADFTSAGVPSLSGSESVGNTEVAHVNDNTTTFNFTTGQTLTLDARAQGGFWKDLGNDMLNDYVYLDANTGHGGSVIASLTNTGLEPSTTYTLHLFGSEGSADEQSAFTPLNNSGITFASSTPSDGNLAVQFTTSASYTNQAIEFTWARASGSPQFAVLNGIAITSGTSGTASMGVLKWKCSTAGNIWVDKADVSLGETIPFSDSAAQRLLVNSTSKLQQIDGWGGSFNERGWKAMEVLSPTARNALMNELFNAETGLKLNLCRTPIGASDYAIDLYSLNETAGDYSMADFSIDRDLERLIPYIKAAQAIRPDLKLWASPWSPPSWMKNNNQLSGRDGSDNSIKDDPRIFDALALYFARYVEAYATEGIQIGMVMPQNEPNMDSNYTSCLWTGSQLAKFIGYHLGPAFASRGIDSEIYLGTINDDDDRGGYAYWVEPSMRDPNVRQYIDGLGCQWDSAPTMAETHLLHPDMKLMQTEAECGNHENNWGFAEYQFGLAQKWFAAGAGSNLIWNLVLDETGLSTGGWAQCSPVVVDSNSGKVTYTPYFYLYKHFSAFVEPGAHVTSTYGSWDDRIVFTNPDGSVVIVLANRTDSDMPVTLNIDGLRTAVITIPARSFNTFTMPAPAPELSALELWRQENFGTIESSGSAEDSADPDADGMSNFLEFSMRSDPTRSEPSLIEARLLSDTFQFHYQRNKDAVNMGVEFDVQWSDTLKQDSWSSFGVTETILWQDSQRQQVLADIPADASERFARLQIIL